MDIYVLITALLTMHSWILYTGNFPNIQTVSLGTPVRSSHIQFG